MSIAFTHSGMRCSLFDFQTPLLAGGGCEEKATSRSPFRERVRRWGGMYRELLCLRLV